MTQKSKTNLAPVVFSSASLNILASSWALINKIIFPIWPFLQSYFADLEHFCLIRIELALSDSE